MSMRMRKLVTITVLITVAILSLSAKTMKAGFRVVTDENGNEFVVCYSAKNSYLDGYEELRTRRDSLRKERRELELAAIEASKACSKILEENQDDPEKLSALFDAKSAEEREFNEKAKEVKKELDKVDAEMKKLVVVEKDIVFKPKAEFVKDLLAANPGYDEVEFVEPRYAK